MFEIGRICIKTAGRDAGRKCVIVDVLDKNYVLIDGETRIRKSIILHLEPLDKVIKINKNASHDEIKKEFEKLGFNVKETKQKSEIKGEAPKETIPAVKVEKKKKGKEAPDKTTKPAKTKNA
jgi:large subunit ribosomal protein L14e